MGRACWRRTQSASRATVIPRFERKDCKDTMHLPMSNWASIQDVNDLVGCAHCSAVLRAGNDVERRTSALSLWVCCNSCSRSWTLAVRSENQNARLWQPLHGHASNALLRRRRLATDAEAASSSRSTQPANFSCITLYRRPYGIDIARCGTWDIPLLSPCDAPALSDSH